MEPVPESDKDYYEEVKEPKDLGTILKNLTDNKYETSEKLIADIKLVWSNCMNYNKEGSALYIQAVVMKKLFDFLVEKENVFAQKMTEAIVLEMATEPLTHEKKADRVRQEIEEIVESMEKKNENEHEIYNENVNESENENKNELKKTENVNEEKKETELKKEPEEKQETQEKKENLFLSPIDEFSEDFEVSVSEFEENKEMNDI